MSIFTGVLILNLVLFKTLAYGGVQCKRGPEPVKYKPP